MSLGHARGSAPFPSVYSPFLFEERGSGRHHSDDRLGHRTACGKSASAPIYFGILKTYVGGLNVLHWVNDALMAMFFLLVGLEIKRELIDGQLASWPRRMLPGIAATTGSSLIESAYPLDLIWQASQPGAPVDRVDLAAGPVCLAVFRRPEDAAFVVLAPGEAAFIKYLCRGDPLATAARYASQVQEDFDPAATFGRMLGLRLLTSGTPT